MINGRSFLLLSICLMIIVAAAAQPRQGQPAAEIALPSATGDTLRLSSLKGKVILLDFWASWCGPCRMANKGLAKLYDKFKEKGFEIYSVSLDDNNSDWQKAVKKDKISWLQVIDRGGWEAPTAQRWNIYALPTTFLIDKEGKLVDMDLEGKALENAVRNLLENK